MCIGASVLLLAFVTRLGLWVGTGLQEAPLGAAPAIFCAGMIDDLRVAVFIGAPFWLAYALAPRRLSGGLAWRLVRAGGAFITLCLLVFSLLAEWVFWDEFSTRFNFIAVDYLIYTHEVINNILQSYPVGWMLLGVALVALLLTRLCLKIAPAGSDLPLRVRLPAGLGAGAALPVLIGLLPAPPTADDNVYTEELSRNGLASFTRAALENELDYHRFYLTLPRAKANRILAGMGVARVPLGSALQPATMMDQAEDELPFTRRPRHVVMVTVESLSADYLAHFGNQQDLTPNLDALAEAGVLFTRLLATGTRTVRGLEAVSLGTPPIPGQAIVRRPGNDHLSTVGEVLAHQGIQTLFLYGGDGFFDNMNAYFAGNDYVVIDRKSIPDDQIVFENAWGVADETLYAQALQEVDRAVAAGKRVFAHVMTTSNHRPYTYPDGRIDRPSPGGREGAVKYSDWALGDFVRRARAKPWFKDTLFVILADHCASAAGKTRLPLYRYHIPMVFYAPELLSPGTDNRLLSQIDLPPTLVEVMGLRGDDHFFGRSIYETPNAPQRAFVSNYQELGYLRDGILTVLRPKSRIESYRIDDATLEATPAQVVPRLRDEAIAWYQTAADAFKEGNLSLHDPGQALR